MVDYYNDEEELDSVDDDDDRSFRGRDSEEGTWNGMDQKLCPLGSVYCLGKKRKHFSIAQTMLHLKRQRLVTALDMVLLL